MATPNDLGPLTRAMMEAEEGEAPNIMREWYKNLKHPNDFVFVWMAATRPWSWISTLVRISDEGDDPASPVATEAAKIDHLLSPMAHEGRIRIMQALYEGPMTPTALTEATGFQGGGLYHHLRELKYAAYVTDEKGQYSLTHLGRQLLITMSLIADQVVEDRGEEGLAAGNQWVNM